MTVEQLIAALEELAEETGPDTEVRLAIQPSYPFQHAIDSVVLVGSEDAIYCDDCDVAWDVHAEEGCGPLEGPEHEELDVDAPVIYIGEGGQLYGQPYLPGVARDALGWGR